MNPIDLVLSRLANPKPNGQDRWRSLCPHCGGTNASALSIGVGQNDAVLITCFKGCDVIEVVGAIGLQLSDLFPRVDTPGGGSSSLKPRKMMSLRQAVDLIEFECVLVWTAAFNLANGHALTTDDLERLAIAGQRIQATIDEARA